MENVFHSGELAVQKMAGEQQMAKMVSRGIKSSIAGGVIPFLRKQPMAFVGSTDMQGRVWLSLLVGEMGFVTVPAAQTIVFDKTMMQSPDIDLFYQNIQQRPEIGILLIDPDSRMRYRINGKATSINNEIRVQVEEAYGNCPKYIQRQVLSLPETVQALPVQITKGDELDNKAIDWIRKADTFYVASQ
ncbi:MAG: pyridoxamine 5'-phosphate oxidase family protein, partial [Bacteroidota bacterium]